MKPNDSLKAAAVTAAGGRTEAEARIDRFRNYLSSWFGAKHASGKFGIIAKDGREVARFDRREDQLAILAAVRALPAARVLVARLELREATFGKEGHPTTEMMVGLGELRALRDAIEEVDAAGRSE